MGIGYVPGKDSAEWEETTNEALAVGYDKFAAPYRKEIKQIAVQTCKHILASMPPGLRQSWLAEQNHFFFLPSAQLSYNLGDYLPESGVRYSYRGTGWDYAKCLYYDPSGKIVPSSAVKESWDIRWRILYHCESYIGIDAINALFAADVEAMRAAFQKSPFYKNSIPRKGVTAWNASAHRSPVQ